MIYTGYEKVWITVSLYTFIDHLLKHIFKVKQNNITKLTGFWNSVFQNEIVKMNRNPNPLPGPLPHRKPPTIIIIYLLLLVLDQLSIKKDGFPENFFFWPWWKKKSTDINKFSLCFWSMAIFYLFWLFDAPSIGGSKWDKSPIFFDVAGPIVDQFY